MKRKDYFPGVIVIAVIAISLLTTPRVTFCEECPINLIGTYEVYVESIVDGDGWGGTGTRTMVITEQNGRTFRGHFVTGEPDSFNGAILGRNICFSHVDSSSFGKISLTMRGKIPIRLLSSGRWENDQEYWSGVLIAVKQD